MDSGADTSRRLIVFIAAAFVVLSLAAVWSRKNNCDEWRDRLVTVLDVEEGLNLIGSDDFRYVFEEPPPYGCNAELDFVG